MADVTEADLASVEAENETKREVLSALKAQEAAIVSAAELAGREEQLVAESKLLDAQIDDQLTALAGHAGANASTDLSKAKADMLAAVQQQVRDRQAADSAASKQAQEKADADRQAAIEAQQEQAKKDAEDAAAKATAALQAAASAAATPSAPPPPTGETGSTPATPDAGTSTPPAQTPAPAAPDAGKGA